MYAVLVFEDLVEIQPDSEEKIKKFLEIPAKLRTFAAAYTPKPAESHTSATQDAMSTGEISYQSFDFVGLEDFCLCYICILGTSKLAQPSFNLDDLDQMEFEAPTPLPKPASKSSAPKPRVPVTRKSAAASKKRKAEGNIDLESFESLSPIEAGNKVLNLQALANMVRMFCVFLILLVKDPYIYLYSQGVEKLMGDYSLLEKQLEEAEGKVKNLVAIAEHKSQHYQLKDAKILNLEKELKELTIDHEKDKAELLHNLKLSALKSVLQAKIRMAKEVAEPGFSPSSWDLHGWETKLQKLNGVVAESSEVGVAMVAGEQVVEAAWVAAVGDEGDIAKA